MEIKQLDKQEYQGREYSAEIHSDRYLSIDPDGEGFKMKWVLSEAELKMSIKDRFLQEWLDHPVAYGAFENNRMIGFVEGFHEKWNNRFRISNICIFEEADRMSGIGTMLLKKIMEAAVDSGARMAVLETQSFNFKAISFYQKNGFEIIGFDRYAYSNKGPEEHHMRIEMGIKLDQQPGSESSKRFISGLK